VVPPAENGALFIATNVIITPNQTKGSPIFKVTRILEKIAQLLEKVARTLA
jgi:hypothetical protein